MKSEEILMNEFCVKCNSEMEEYKTNMIISKGLFNQKHAYAKVCKECDSLEFYLQ
jgi:hypothetical protein